MDIVVQISPAQKKALETEIEDITSWFANWLYFRANEMVDKLVQKEIQRRLENGETVSGSKEDIILSSTVLSAVETNALASNLV